MSHRDPFGKARSARRMLEQAPYQQSSSPSYQFPSRADMNAQADRAIQQLRGDVRTYYDTLRRERIQPYVFAGQASRTRTTSTTGSFNPIESHRQSRRWGGGPSSTTSRWHDITFRGWPIGDFGIVPTSGEDHITEGRSLVLLEAGKVALGSRGIFGVFDGFQESDPRLPSRRGAIDIGRLYENGFPVSIGALAASQFRAALASEVAPYDSSGVPTDLDAFRLTMTMVLQRG